MMNDNVIADFLQAANQGAAKCMRSLEVIKGTDKDLEQLFSDMAEIKKRLTSKANALEVERMRQEGTELLIVNSVTA